MEFRFAFGEKEEYALNLYKSFGPHCRKKLIGGWCDTYSRKISEPSSSLAWYVSPKMGFKGLSKKCAL